MSEPLPLLTVAQQLCRRAIALDRLYLAADAALMEYVHAEDGPRKKQLYRRQRRLWNAYHTAVAKPMPRDTCLTPCRR